MIRKGISRSRKMGSLGPKPLALFCLLLPHLNAHGKMEAHPAAIKGIVCPWVEWLDIPTIDACLREISSTTNLKWFECDGGYFLHALSWDEHQDIRKRGRDYLPSFPGELPTSAGSGAVQHPTEVEVEREGEREGEREEQRAAAPEPRKRSHRPPIECVEAYGQRVETFFTRFLDEDHSAWAKAFPGIDIETEVLKAKLWLLSNPTNKKKNFDRFVTNWLARSQERGARISRADGSNCLYAPGTPEHEEFLAAKDRWKGYRK